MFKFLFKIFGFKIKSNNNLSIVANKSIVEHKTFNSSGEFVNRLYFEYLWVMFNVHGDYCALEKLNDDEYIDYQIWKDINIEKLFEKYFPNAIVFVGKNPNIIFHEGCLGCLSQRLHGFDRCKSCDFFRATVKETENLYIKGEDSAKINGEDLNNLLNGE